MSEENKFPNLIYIPLPTAIPIGRGVESTRGPYGIFFGGRGLQHEKDLIHEAAARIGITYGEFLRRSVVDAARFVLKHIPEQD